MKKLFRLFIALFCIFFALHAIPGDYQPALRSLFHRAAEAVGEFTVILAEGIDQAEEYILALKGSSAGDGADGEKAPADSAGNDSRESSVGSGRDAEESSGSGGIAEENSGSGGDAAEGSGGTDGGQAAGHASGESKESEEEEPDASVGSEEAPGEGDGNPSEPPASSDPDGDKEESLVRGPVPDEEIVYYYYTRISEEERLLYDAMLALAQNRDNDGSLEESRLVSLDPASEEFSVSYTRAFNALINDHPELFWISMSRAVYQCRYYVLPAFGGRYKVIFTLSFPGAEDGGDGSSGMDLRNRYAEEQDQLRTAADALLDQVDFTRSDAGIALQLHDLLLDCAWYNRGAGFDDYAHTAYGALVADSSGNPGGALCDGYSLAYVYLLQRSGLTGAMIGGLAGSSEEDLEKHAWNIVLLDQDWYEVDATWDDLDFEVSPSEEGYDLLMEALSDEAYMSLIRHYMFNRTTDQMRTFDPGEEYRYTSDGGWVSLLQPSVHLRYTEEDSESSRDYITPLAPRAEGTYYTWSLLSGL